MKKQLAISILILFICSVFFTTGENTINQISEPHLTIYSPTGDINSSSVQLTLELNDSNGWHSLEVSIGGIFLYTLSNDGGTHSDQNLIYDHNYLYLNKALNLLNKGNLSNQTLKIEASNSQGQSVFKNFNVIYDIQKPDIQWIGDYPNYISDNIIDLTWQVTDASQITQIVSVNGKTQSVTILQSGDTFSATLNLTVRNAEYQEFIISLHVTDSNGNIGVNSIIFKWVKPPTSKPLIDLSNTNTDVLLYFGTIFLIILVLFGIRLVVKSQKIAATKRKGNVSSPPFLDLIEILMNKYPDKTYEILDTFTEIEENWNARVAELNLKHGLTNNEVEMFLDQYISNFYIQLIGEFEISSELYTTLESRFKSWKQEVLK